MLISRSGLLDVTATSKGATMDAVGGDRIGVAAAMLDGAVRDGEVIEVAAVRALRRLADWLLGVASGDIEAVEGREVPLRR